MTPHPHQIAIIRQKGIAARLAHQALNQAFAAGLRGRDSQAYQKLLVNFRAATAAAMPDIRLDQLANGDRTAIDHAIAFLAADPYFFRSGYLKTALLRKLKQARVSDDHKAALANLVIQRVTEPGRSNRKDFGRLAAALRWLQLDRKLVALLDNQDDGVRERALEMLQQIISARDIAGA